jgi:hypothetical protein
MIRDPVERSQKYIKTKKDKLGTDGSSVIPATWEAKIRRITVRGQPGQIVLEMHL